MFRRNVFLLVISLLSSNFVYAELFRSVATMSQSSRYMEIWFTLSEAKNDCYANVYDSNWPGSYLEHAEITSLNGETQYSATVEIPQPYLAAEKTFVITCGGEDYRYKVPRPPKVRMAASMEQDSTGQMFFLADAYIENQEAGGKCWMNHNLEQFELLPTDPGAPRYFRADYFIDVKPFDVARRYPVKLNIFCQNSGGVTHTNQRWEYGADDKWQLMNYTHTYY